MGKNGGKKSKSKQTDKNIVPSMSMGEAHSKVQANVTQDTTVGRKLDALLAVVSDMGQKLTLSPRVSHSKLRIKRGSRLSSTLL